MDNAFNPFDIVGLLGVACSTFAYARVQWDRSFANKISYSLLNLCSAILVGISFFGSWNLTTFICNAIWGTISLYGLYHSSRFFRRAWLIKHSHD